MKYTIELTNKQKAQMDCIIDIVHRYVGFNPKLEPIKATNVEDTSEYQIGYKVGFADGKKQAIEEIPELANKENEIYNDVYNKGYNKGLEDASSTIWTMLTSKNTGEIFTEYGTVSDILGNVHMKEIRDRIRAYVEKKKAEEESIKVGDVVKFNEKCHDYDRVKSREFLVLHMFDNGLVTILYDNGDTGAAEISLLDKTGRHIDEVEQLLDKLKGEE